MWTYPGYHINKGLGIVFGELHDRPNLIAVGEHFRDQRDTLVRGEGMRDQLLPGWVFAACEKAVS